MTALPPLDFKSLFTKIPAPISELAPKIENTAEQLRQMASHSQDIREEERKRIGREIHDELGQQLTAIRMDVAWVDKQIPEKSQLLKNKLKNIITLLDRSNQSIRNILTKLRPVILDGHNFLKALNWQNHQFTESTGIPVNLITVETDIKLTDEISTGILRVYQESLTNIMRYAQASKVLTTLSIKDNRISLTIEDDGNGFDTAVVQNKRSFGILGMKERVFLQNGKFELVSVVGKGTKISISIPYITEIQT